MTFANCLTFALGLWRYLDIKRYLMIRKSKWAWFPHFAVVIEQDNGDLMKLEYVPTEPRNKKLPPLFFNGKVVLKYYKLVGELQSK